MHSTKERAGSYAISLAVHLLLLLLLGLFWFRPAELTKWHEFEWITDAESQELSAAETPSIGTDIPGAAGDTEAGAPLAAPANATVKPITSPLIETPVIGDTRESQANPAIIDHSELSGQMRDVGNANESTGTDYAYNASLVSGSAEAYIIRQSPPKISPQMDDEVLIEFRLSESGQVLMNTVSVLSYRQSVHWEAIRKEMPSWRFGFKGLYNAGRTYRIRVVFRVK